MLVNIAIGCCLVIVTTFLHATAMVGVLRMLKISHAALWAEGSGLHAAKAAVVAAVVLTMFLASIIEALLWAATYLLFGAMDDPERAIYFSTVTYTTLGFGDVVLPNNWRLLSAFEAANGIIMFGWTTAIIIATVQRMYGPSLEIAELKSDRAKHQNTSAERRDV